VSVKKSFTGECHAYNPICGVTMKAFITKANLTGGNDPGTSTTWGAKESNSVTEELKNFVVSAGQTPTAGTGDDTDTEMLSRGITTASQTAHGFQDSGVANTYILSAIGSLKHEASYVDRERLTFITSNENTGASTVNVLSRGVKKILLQDGSTDLSGGEIKSNTFIELIYSNTADGGSGAYLITEWSIAKIQQVMIIVDEKPLGTNGGTFTSGAWRTRDLNKIIKNTIPGASLASNKITLPEGEYFLEAFVPAGNVNLHQARAWNNTLSAVLITGGSVNGRQNIDTDIVNTISVVSGTFVLVATTDIEIIHKSSETSVVGTGFGTAVGFTDEIYTQVKIWKI